MLPARADRRARPFRPAEFALQVARRQTRWGPWKRDQREAPGGLSTRRRTPNG